MTEEKKESRTEEVARVRSYLASQSMKRTPAQLVENLQEAHTSLVKAANAVPNDKFHMPPSEGEWSAAQVLEHVRMLAERDVHSIMVVLTLGRLPDPQVGDLETPAPSPTVSRQELLVTIQWLRHQLINAVMQADPQVRLDMTWSHSEFGEMNWREWLLFARVHTLDHARQLEAIAQLLMLEEV